jgi:hypothetical protein
MRRFGARSNAPGEVRAAFDDGLVVIEEALRKPLEAGNVDAQGEVVLTTKNFARPDGAPALRRPPRPPPQPPPCPAPAS